MRVCHKFNMLEHRRDWVVVSVQKFWASKTMRLFIEAPQELIDVKWFNRRANGNCDIQFGVPDNV
jgi:hypothetical protein